MLLAYAQEQAVACANSSSSSLDQQEYYDIMENDIKSSLEVEVSVLSLTLLITFEYIVSHTRRNHELIHFRHVTKTNESCCMCGKWP